MKKTLSILITVILILQHVSAEGYRFRQLGVRQGLSSNTVNTMMIDSRGMLWVGTSIGVNRYDGYEVRQFRYIDAERRVPASSVNWLMEDAAANIWVDFNGIMARYDLHRQQFFMDNDEYLRSLGITLPKKWNMTVDSHGGLWIMGDGILIHYDYATAKHEKWKTALKIGSADWHLADCAEGLYLTDGSEVWKFLSKTGQSQRISLPVAMASSKGHLRLYVDTENTLWVYSTVNEGIYHHKGTQLQLPRGSASNAIRDIFDDGHGKLYVATDHNGAFVFSKQGGAPLHLLHVQGDATSITSDNVTCVTADHHGTIWLGHFKTGVSYTDTGHSLFKNEGQQYGDISTIMFTRSGDLWLGTDGDGVFVELRNGLKQKAAVPSVTISSLIEDHAGTVWIGTYNSGLYRMNGTSVAKAYTQASGALRSDAAWQMAEDNHHNIWIATGFGVLTKFNIDTETSTEVRADGKTIVGLSLAFDGHHTMYVGTYYGVWAFDTDTGKGVNLLGNRRGTQQMLQPAVVSLCYDGKRDAVWIAHTTGISVLDVKRDSMFYFNEDNGLFDSYVKTIVAGRDGIMWLSTSHGISSIQPTKEGGYVVHNFPAGSGLLNDYFNTFAAACSPEGDIFMGGHEGLTVVSMQSVAQGGERPKLTLSEVTVGGRQVLADDDGVVRLSYDDRQIVFRFFTGNLASNGRVIYAYRIKQLGKDWIYTDKNAVSLLTLAHGTYTLEIKAVSENGEWGEVTSVTIEVAPPFYLSWWMMIVYALLALGAAFALNRYFHRRHLLRMEQQRENLEQQQQVQLSEMKLRFFTNISHDLRTPLTLIMSPLQSLLSGDISQQLREKLEMIYRNAELLYNQVNNLLDFRRLDVGAEKLTLQSIDVAQYVGNICLSFSNYASERGISLTYEPQQEHLFFTVDAKKLNKIMYNLLSNALKFTDDGGRVSVRLREDSATGLAISVADTGCGIADEDKERIFQRFYQVRNDDAKAGSGIGLHIVSEYVRMHGGNITVGDNEPQGAVFSVQIPPSMLEDDRQEIATPLVETANSETLGRTDNPVTILVVDDNHDLRTFIADSLHTAYKEKGYTIMQAADGQEALDLLKNNDVTLVVTDIMMPRVDGMELTRCIKTDISTSHIPVIMLTAKQTDQDIVGGLKIGADDYLTKPFNIEHLILRIDKFIEWTRTSHETFQRKIEVKPSEITITSLDEEFISKAISLVEDHMADSDYSVEQLSSDLNMSRANLYKKMMSIVGNGPHEFMRTIRLKRAHQLLERSQKQVAEVAYAVGYSSPKRFSENFKAEYGMTPSEFVRSCRGKLA